MGTSLTTKYKFIKPDDSESVDVAHLNKNFDDIDKLIPEVIVTGIPEGKTPKMWSGRITISTGKGGESRTVSGATNKDGVGGIWLGANGVPNFEGIVYARVDDGGSSDAFAWYGVIMEANSTRIKFRAKKFESQTLALDYGTMNVYVQIVGW